MNNIDDDFETVFYGAMETLIEKEYDKLETMVKDGMFDIYEKNNSKPQKEQELFLEPPNILFDIAGGDESDTFDIAGGDDSDNEFLTYEDNELYIKEEEESLFQF